MNFNKFLQISIPILLCIFVPIGAEAAVLYLEPVSGEFQSGSTFIVEIKIDAEAECINTIKADLEFSQDILEAVDFSQGDSILTIWIEPPFINQAQGLVSFTGGIPGGYCGEIPGDPGESNILGKIIFRVVSRPVSRGFAQVGFRADSQVLLNDGLGTPAKLTTKGAVFTILPGKAEIPKDEWKEELRKDDILPETFIIEVYQEPSIFEGKYFIIFSTIDKETGIDYYEAKEGERDWKKAESPYLLEDQTLQSIIKVKAVDKAGNERIAEYIPPRYKLLKKLLPYLVIILVLIGSGIIWWTVRKLKAQSAKRKTTT